MKLEEIKKENIYTVPDKYFDQLPTRIQSRVHVKKPVLGISLNWNSVYKIAAPVFAVVLMVVYFGIPKLNNSAPSAEDFLAQVSSDDLIAYLQTTDITTDDIAEELDLTNIDLDFYIIDTDTLDSSLSKSTLVIGPTSTVFFDSFKAGVYYLIFQLEFNGVDLINGYRIPGMYNGDNSKVPVAKSDIIMQHSRNHAGSSIGGSRHYPAKGGIFLIHRQGKTTDPIKGIFKIIAPCPDRRQPAVVI